MNKKKLGMMLLLAGSVTLSGCNPGSPESSGKYDLKGSADQVSDNEYKKMSAQQQYQIANRLMSALFKGIPANEFFRKGTIGADPSTLEVATDYENFLSTMRLQLKKPADNTEETYTLILGDPDQQIEGKYDIRSEPMEFPLAYMYELPVSWDFFTRWMAYKLVNTIMFSPAEEIDSADDNDVRTVYESLVSAIKENASIRSIVLAHQKSETNWRRFRSPEDNTREMIEIYLGLFDRDADVPKASQACQNWSLTDQANDYKLAKSANVNTQAVLVLDSYWVTTCEDFYEAIANHPLLIPRVTRVLIDHMFGVTYDEEVRSQLEMDIAASNPETFTDIFLAILFSEEFLLKMERPKWFEEAFFNQADRTHWRPYRNFFRDLVGYTTGGSTSTLGMNMVAAYQPTFSLKLGRWPSVPQDVLAVSYAHKGVRNVFMERSADPLNTGDWGWGAAFIADAVELKTDEFISYVFLGTLGRMPSELEMSTLTAVIETAYRADDVDKAPWLDAGSRWDERTIILLDYISRLPETYFYVPVSAN